MNITANSFLSCSLCLQLQSIYRQKCWRCLWLLHLSLGFLGFCCNKRNAWKRISLLSCSRKKNIKPSSNEKTKEEGDQALNRHPRAMITVPGLAEFRMSLGNILQYMLWVLRCPVQGQELDLVILVDPLQLRLFYDYKRHERHQVVGNASAAMHPLSFQKAASSCWAKRAWSGTWKTLGVSVCLWCFLVSDCRTLLHKERQTQGCANPLSHLQLGISAVYTRGTSSGGEMAPSKGSPHLGEYLLNIPLHLLCSLGHSGTSFT